ncbi:MAG: hypothetical protein EXS13_13005 [Planctomycetes bacterium]|nr:hypothetical protein [Planctomycetota bacterium]
MDLLRQHLLAVAVTVAASLAASISPAQDAAGPTSEPTLAREAALEASLPDAMRRELENRLRVLNVAAHPDDEDGALLKSFARQGAEIWTLFSTRGEGGQNAIGHDLEQELGSRREEETLAASAVVGSTPWFLGFPDFGFSKRADETFTRWGGRDEVVRRITWVIRTFKPHRIFTNHPQTGGHGHHQATSIALHEAIVAAADPARYPEQLAEGLAVWSADALFVRIGRDDPAAELTLAIDYDVAVEGDPAGKTLAEIAHTALLRHASQGPWRAFDAAAKHAARYTITWSSPTLRTLRELPQRTTPLPERSATAAFTIADLLALLASPAFSGTNAPSQARVDHWLTALAGAELAFPDDEGTTPRGALLPGEPLRFLVLLHGRDPLYRGAECAAALERLEPVLTLEGPGELTAQASAAAIAARPELRATFRDALAAAATLTVANAAPWSWPAPERTVGPFSGSHRHPFTARVTFTRDGRQLATLRLPITKAIAPALVGALSRDPLPLVRPPGTARANGALRLRFPTGRVPQGELHLRAPTGFHFESLGARLDALPVTLPAVQNLGDTSAPLFELPFTLVARELPPADPERATLRLPLAFALEFADGAPIATILGELAILDVLPPSTSRIAFVPGADGSAGLALDDLGVPCTRLSPEALAREPLTRFSHVLLDARTLGTSEALRQQSARLREFVARGGHVVVLYHKTSEWNEWAKLEQTPAPARLELADVRVCEESSAMTILAHGHPRLLHPNVILQRDFDGWTQERGLYFPEKGEKLSYDDRYVELLACADAGEPQHKGGLLEWRNEAGGTFVFCAYALHRQLRAGHGGGWRLFANLLALPPAR